MTAIDSFLYSYTHSTTSTTKMKKNEMVRHVLIFLFLAIFFDVVVVAVLCFVCVLYLICIAMANKMCEDQ